MSRRWFLLGLLPLFLSLVMAGCNQTVAPSTDREPPSGRPVLKVGVNPDYPPMIFTRGGRIEGLEADFARMLAAELGMNLEFVVMDWEQLIPALQEGEIDIIMSAMSITKLRSMLVRFTSPYMSIGQLALVRARDAAKYPFAKALQLREDRIGVKKGTTGEIFVRQACPQATAVPFDNPDDAFKALLAGDIDVMIHDAPYIWSIAAENESKGVEILPFYLTKEQLAWAVNRQNGELADTINRILVKWDKQDKMRPVIKRWLPL